MRHYDYFVFFLSVAVFAWHPAQAQVVGPPASVLRVGGCVHAPLETSPAGNRPHLQYNLDLDAAGTIILDLSTNHSQVAIRISQRRGDGSLGTVTGQLGGISVGNRTEPIFAYVPAGSFVIDLEWTTRDYSGQLVGVCLDFISSAQEVNQTFDDAPLIETGRQYVEHLLGENEQYTTPDNPSPLDQDWFRLDFRQGGTMLVDVSNIPEDLDLEVDILGLDYRGRPVVLTRADLDYRGANKYGLRAAAYVAPDNYFIRVRSRNNGTSPAPYYLYADFIENEHEANQTYDDAPLIETGRQYVERILGENAQYIAPNSPSPLDQDWFRLDFMRGGTMLVDVSNIPQDLDLEVDILGLDYRGRPVVLTRADLNYRGTNNYGLRAAAYVAPGTYFIRVRSRGNGTSLAPYYLYADFITNEHEANQTYDDAPLIETGRQYVERILGENAQFVTPNSPNPLDQDWFRLDFGRGGTMLVDVFNIPEDLDLEVDILGLDYRGNPVVLTRADLDYRGASNYGLQAAVDVSAGNYFIRVRSRSNGINLAPYYLYTDFIEDLETEPGSLGIGTGRPRPNLPVGERHFLKDKNAGTDRRALPLAFPNPTTGVIRLSGPHDRATYVVSNSLGQEVATGTAVNPRIDLSRMTAGFYTITIRDDQPDPTTIRVVKR